MIKKIGKIGSSILIGLLLISIFAMISPVTSAQEERGRILEFPSYITITYDPSALEKPFMIDKAVNVPIKIEYSHQVPSAWYKLIPLPTIRNLFFFGNAMAPQVLIKLEIVDKPDWANIHFTQPDLLFEMPEPGESITQETQLVISPYREAPAKPYTITLRATSERAGRVKGFTRDVTITFTPNYIPMISIEVDKPMRQVSPRETVNFNIKITNNANKDTVVRCSYVAPEEWAPIITPREIELKPLQTGQVTFSVRAPYDIGWHDQTVSMRVICQPYPSPLSPDINQSEYEIAAQVADIQVTNYGFSVGGAEPFIVVLIVILIIIVVVILKFKMKK